MIEYKIVITEPEPGCITIERRPVRGTDITRNEQTVYEHLIKVLDSFNRGILGPNDSAEIIEGTEGVVGPILDARKRKRL